MYLRPPQERLIEHRVITQPVVNLGDDDHFLFVEQHQETDNSTMDQSKHQEEIVLD